ncbi:Serine/threonine-protein kinase pkn1 [Microbacterium oxydans]|uniref:Serine/threonine-protein kinase pkn1 n=1 Tax=Microbacterium oxydans TaxID=82380 RepID=A0A0F0KF03_9MICO|nr:SUMF1/EgtB/PvdO family nonheme iron enzyme [Microbacterium oxydans]KJL18710.1 Serine/threonine-protein kinase pkn1 [Microbacterium oxydans]
MSDFELAAISAGTVTLHDARRQERREVALEPFEIGVFPVTEEQLAEVLGVPARHPRRPAADLSWLRAVHFCNAASEWEGLERSYSFDGEVVTWDTTADGYRLPTEAEWEFACRAGSTGPHYAPLADAAWTAADGVSSFDGEVVTWDTTADGYRLPTEAEWEFACRAGSTGPHYAPLADAAWTAADGVSSPQDVGGKLPNLNGLFDTLGNVWEWCWDLLDPARYDDYRVFRGGGFADDAWSVRASVRRGGAPRMHHQDVGLRLARGAFDTPGRAQGWSERADRERAVQDGPLPSGWTPRRG